MFIEHKKFTSVSLADNIHNNNDNNINNITKG